jgi:hypothetical protein
MQCSTLELLCCPGSDLHHRTGSCATLRRMAGLELEGCPALSSGERRIAGAVLPLRIAAGNGIAVQGKDENGIGSSLCPVWTVA